MQQQTANYQTAAGAVSQMGPVTVIHFALIALVAVMAIVIIVVGARLAHRRHRAEAEAVEYQHEAAQASPAVPTPVPDVAAPPPLSPVIEPGTGPVEPVGVMPEPSPSPAPAAGPGDLTRLKGLGPRIAARLGELGVYSIADMARLTPEAARTLDAELTPFQGRLSRDRWVDQAKLLAAGDVEAYEREFGKLG
jgi:predicted flap endonuclease-1-like 5' DNA nuclease